ncbi:unnamed protein product [Cladocopium goreaui]|uniref:1,4-alpha-glucan-branching enzyme 2-2, chloroplastic/amyloplastic n=1 Tax=Cladocopium goreaui TaxID=2562237 RepID=A0A9P1C3P5_9DINO|nr:unnamed protein product [Cladocopium goreaui]
MKFTVSEGRLLVKLPGPSAFKVYWEVHKGGVTRKSGAPNPNATKVKLPFALDTYRVYFPGTYILDHLGNLKCARELLIVCGICFDHSFDKESDAAEQGDGVPQGCKDVRAKSQNFLAPSEMPEESSKKAEASETMAADAPKWAPAPDKSEVEAAKPEAFDISSDSDESEVLNGQAYSKI